MGSTCMRYDSSMSRMDFLLKHIGANYSNEEMSQRILKAQMVGTTLYAAVERVEKADNSRNVWALVVISTIHGSEICYKAMDEGMGPFQAECPKSVLDLLSPTDSTWATEWRQRCRANLAASSARRILDGQVVVLKELVNFTGGISSRVFMKTPGRSLWWTLQTEEQPFYPIGEKRDKVRLSLKGHEIDQVYPSVAAYVSAMTKGVETPPSTEQLDILEPAPELPGQTMTRPAAQ